MTVADEAWLDDERPFEPDAAGPSRPLIEHRQLGNPVAVYDYRRLDGSLAFVVCRFEPKEFRPAQLRGDHWVWNLRDAPVLPYRLQDVERALTAGETIHIVDGEKDADAIAAAGGVATCCARAQGWTLELAEQLTGARRIRIVADRDGGTGARQARDVAKLLVDAGAIASSDIEIVEAAEGKDAYDHLAAGRSLDELEIVADPFPSIETSARVRVVPFDEFVVAEEALADPLIGDDEKKLLPAGSTLVFYGEGGSGKTTLAIDMAFHLAAGADWLGFRIPAPVTVMLLENEGPRAEYRIKLRRKRDTWTGAPVDEHLVVSEDPWGRVDFRNREHVDELAAAIVAHNVDVMIAGPIRRLGLEGGGTPAETVAFMRLLDDVRAAAGRPVSNVLSHHENKGGDISGAFEAEFDTVIHVKPDGRDRTTLYIRKSRWSSRLHRSRFTLKWVPDSEGFTVAETDIDAPRGAAQSDAAEITALEWIVAHVADHHARTGDGIAKGKVETAYHEAHGGHGRNLARRVIEREIAAWTGERNGEDTPALATCPGEVRNGIYLVPSKYAASPLADTPNGEGGEHIPNPASGASARHLAAAPKGGEGSAASGVEPTDDEELEWH